MKSKPKTPYQHLLEEIRRYCGKLTGLYTIGMWRYPKDKLNQDGGWHLGDLWERTAAAKQLGYEVVLLAQDDGLHVKYRKIMPEVPHQWR